MADEKLRAEWFWTDKWMLSSAFLLPAEPRGVYREMLTQAWVRGARLPNDHEAIRRATGISVEEWERCWPRIEGYWRVDGAYLVNDTQLEVYAKAQAERKKAHDRAQDAANARWEREREKERKKQSRRNAQAERRAQLAQSPKTKTSDPLPSVDREQDTPTGGAERASGAPPSADAPPATLRPGLDYLPEDPLQGLVAERINDLAEDMARKDHEPCTDAIVRRALEAASVTKNGDKLDSLVHASEAWLRATYSQAGRLQNDLVDADDPFGAHLDPAALHGKREAS